MIYLPYFAYRDEDRDKTCDNLKSSSSEESVRKRRPSASLPKNSQLFVFQQGTQYSEIDNNSSQEHLHKTPPIQPSEQQTSTTPPILLTTISKPSEIAPNTTDHIKVPVNNKSQNANVVSANCDNDCHYESLDQAVKTKYAYHDEPHSFENSMDFLEDYNPYQFEVLETTV